MPSALGGVGYGMLMPGAQLRQSGLDSGSDSLNQSLQWLGGLFHDSREKKLDRKAAAERQKQAEKSALTNMLVGAGINLGTDFLAAGAGAAGLSSANTAGGDIEAPIGGGYDIERVATPPTMPAPNYAGKVADMALKAEGTARGAGTSVIQGVLDTPGAPAAISRNATSLSPVTAGVVPPASLNIPTRVKSPTGSFGGDFGLLFAGTKIPGLVGPAIAAPLAGARTALDAAELGRRYADDAEQQDYHRGMLRKYDRANDIAERRLNPFGDMDPGTTIGSLGGNLAEMYGVPPDTSLRALYTAKQAAGTLPRPGSEHLPTFQQVESGMTHSPANSPGIRDVLNRIKDSKGGREEQKRLLKEARERHNLMYGDYIWLQEQLFGGPQ